MRKSAALMIAAGLATAAVGVIPQAEARPWGWGGGWGRAGWYGGYARPWGGYYRRGWGWGGGALAAGLAVGAAGGLIASSLAAPAYAYGYPYYGYPAAGYGYGYPATTVGYGYGYGYPATTVAYPAPVVVRRRVVYRAPLYRNRVVVRRAYGFRPAAVYGAPRAGFYRPATYRQRMVYGARPVYRRGVRY